MFDDFFTDYLRGYNSDQLERARFLVLANILIDKGIITIEDFNKYWEQIPEILKEIVKRDKKELEEKEGK